MRRSPPAPATPIRPITTKGTNRGVATKIIIKEIARRIIQVLRFSIPTITIIGIAKRNGIIGICLCSSFLKKEGKANVTDIIRHIKHITNLVGIDYIGLGTDFDGVDEEHRLSDIKGIKDMPILINELRKSGYLEDQIGKIMGENWMRVLSKI